MWTNAHADTPSLASQAPTRRVERVPNKSGPLPFEIEYGVHASHPIFVLSKVLGLFGDLQKTQLHDGPGNNSMLLDSWQRTLAPAGSVTRMLVESSAQLFFVFAPTDDQLQLSLRESQVDLIVQRRRVLTSGLFLQPYPHHLHVPQIVDTHRQEQS